jgi:acyl-ACP thioesterase
MGICELATIHPIKYNTMKRYVKPISCGRIIKIKNKQHDSFSLNFTSQSQIDDFIKMLKCLKAKKINHVHIQVLQETEKGGIEELTIHYPPATAKQWPHYFE